MKRRRTKEEESFADELRGLLMESYAEAQKGAGLNHAQIGHLMKRQMERGAALLERIGEYYCPERITENAQATGAKPVLSEKPKPVPATNGQETPRKA